VPNRFIPRSLSGKKVITFNLEPYYSAKEVLEVIGNEISEWLEDFTEQYGYHLPPLDPAEELVFPLEVDIALKGPIGDSRLPQAHSLTVECQPEGLHERFLHYELTLNKRDAA